MKLREALNLLVDHESETEGINVITRFNLVQQIQFYWKLDERIFNITPKIPLVKKNRYLIDGEVPLSEEALFNYRDQIDEVKAQILKELESEK